MQVDCMGYFGHKAPARPNLAFPYAWVSDEEMFRAVFIHDPFLKDGGSRVEFRSQVVARRWGGWVSQVVWVWGGKCGVAVEVLWWVERS